MISTRRAPRSLCSCLLVLLMLLGIRSYYSDFGGGSPHLVLTRWDAFGYYLYLPATAIYQDYKKLDWADSIDRKYGVTGGDGLPVQVLENGNKVSKYLGGVAILQTPFFVAGHVTAGVPGAPQDGFSAPYQYALGFGALLYTFLALLLLRRLLLCWFSDGVVAWTLLLTALATNLPQYAAVHAGLSHAWILPLYVLVLRTTLRWHEEPRWHRALATGYIIGLATICRPTEAVMLFIPLLWGLENRGAARKKWALVRRHRAHVLIAVAGGLLGILPQLLYWKSVTGSFIYDVGSKWQFLTPWFRVLTGWEKGWFIYTPVTILFVIGLFTLKRYPFRYAVLAFCLLNIWVVIAWDDWQYGASYSARALVQSYPVLAFALAALLARLPEKRRWLIAPLACCLIGVNIFQVWQYNAGIIHHRDMNRAYYSRVFLNPRPTAMDMSLLDGTDWPDLTHTVLQPLVRLRPQQPLQSGDGSEILLYRGTIDSPRPEFIRIDAALDVTDGRWDSKVGARLRDGDGVRSVAVRLSNPVADRSGAYAFAIRVPDGFRAPELEVFIKPGWRFEGACRELQISALTEGGK